MKKIIFLIFSTLFLQACTDDDKKITNTPSTVPQKAPQTKLLKADPATKAWNGTSLSDATIKKIQEVKYVYSQCVYTEAQKKGYAKIDSRVATDAVIKQCEAELSIIRTTFLDEGVPGIVANRYLKKTRTDMTRKILKSFMFAEAARKAGATQ